MVTTLPISTTNMTGLPIIVRGFSLSSASQRARLTIFHSQIALALFAIADSLKCLARTEEQVLQDRAQAQGWKKCQCANDGDYAD